MHGNLYNPPDLSGLYPKHGNQGALAAYDCGPCSVGSTMAMVVNTLYAMFFFTGRGGIPAYLACNVTVAAAGKSIRMGAYLLSSNKNLYPGALLLDAGTVTTDATGIKEVANTIALPPNKWIWLACISDGTPTLTRHNPTGPVLIPLSGAFAAGTNISVAQAYGALPATFPAGGALGMVPAVAVKWTDG